MSLNIVDFPRRAPASKTVDATPPSVRARAEVFSTALFTGVNIAVFLVLAACVAAAAILYGIGA